jgi:hypothetical protein
MASLWVMEPNREIYENFGIFGFSIVDFLGCTSVSNFLEICYVLVPSSVARGAIEFYKN